jgi:hypothetical protein
VRHTGLAERRGEALHEAVDGRLIPVGLAVTDTARRSRICEIYVNSERDASV